MNFEVMSSTAGPQNNLNHLLSEWVASWMRCGLAVRHVSDRYCHVYGQGYVGIG